MHIRFSNVSKLTGLKTESKDFKISDFLTGHKGRCIVLLTWAEGELPGYLKFALGTVPTVKSAGPSPLARLNSKPVKFSIDNDVAKLRAALKETVGRDIPLRKELVDGTWNFLAESVGVDELLRIAVDLNTSIRSFTKLKDGDLTALDNGEHGIQVKIRAYVYSKQNETPSGAAAPPKELPIVIEGYPCLLPAEYAGWLAIDLGNTGTTLAGRLSPQGQAPRIGLFADPQANQAEILSITKDDAAPGLQHEQSDVVPSAVRLLKYGDPIETDDMAVVKWTIGRTALIDSSDDGLLLGAKRMAVDPNASQGFKVPLHQENVVVDKTLPAELLAAGIFQDFIRAYGRLPQNLAVTYPTTFSMREAERLKQAIFDGLQRARGASKYWPSSTFAERQERTLEVAKRIKLSLDEATAAAVYLLHRDIIKAPGGILGFMHAYPDGMVLLLFDCGGGTTDIALVHAKAETRFDAVTNSPTYSIALDVIGRTGHRAFGGDYITLQTCRLLKAHIAAVAAGRLATQRAVTSRDADKVKIPPEVISNAALLEDHLTKSAAIVNHFVRTEYTPGDGSATPSRREASKLLWNWAEAIKISPEETVKLRPEPLEALTTLLTETHGVDFASDVEFAKQLGNIVITKAQINSLIKDRLTQAVTKMNALVGNRLRPDVGDDEDPSVDLPRHAEVDWVYVVGNAARYPYIRQQIEEGLNVRFVKERIKFDQEDAKSAVAVGACIALSVHDCYFGFEFRHDRDLAKRLPYDVLVAMEGVARQDALLYKEHSLYDDLPDRVRAVPARPEFTDDAEENQKWKGVSLERLWPGDKVAEGFMTFSFRNPIRSPLQIRYDQDAKTFFMSHADEPNEVPGKEIVKDAEYLSPIQSGRI